MGAAAGTCHCIGRAVTQNQAMSLSINDSLLAGAGAGAGTPSAPVSAAPPAWQAPFTHHPPCELGESPFWHPTEQRLVWIDIVGKQVLRGDPGTGQVDMWPMPAQPGCIAPVRWVSGKNATPNADAAAASAWVIALRTGVFVATQWGGPLKLLAPAPYDTTTTRFNDGKASPTGLLCVGTYFEPRNAPNAELWCLDVRQPPMGTLDASAATPPAMQRLLAGSMVANGLAWSPSGTTLFWADTGRHRVGTWRWPLVGDAHPTPGAHPTWAQFAEKPAHWLFGQPEAAPRYGGRPDGAAVDDQGNYWVAMFEGGQIAQLSPTGALHQTLATPVQRPTMPCWGGADLSTLFVTTARHGRSAAEEEAEPLAGHVFCVKTAVRGLPVDFVDVHECYK